MPIYRKPKRKALAQPATRSVKRRVTAYKPLDTNKGTNPQSMLVHRGVGFPDRFRTKIVYTNSFILSGFSTVTTQKLSFRMNGPWDPLEALGGGQPTYWDQLASIYNRQTVVGSKATATFALTQTVTTSDGPYIVGIQCGNSATLPTNDAANLTTAPNTGYQVISQGSEPKMVTSTYATKLLTLIPGDDTVSSTTAAVPSRQWFANVFASPQGASTAGTVNVVLTIEYICDFFENKSIVDV